MSELHALLIGIDDYPADFILPGSKECYPPLPGCVADVEAVANYLREDLGVNRLTLLTAAVGSQPSAPDTRPTYENIVGALQRLEREAAPGDQVYIHFSGHGGLVPTLIPKAKSSHYDETWVPVNIDDPQARHLRDVEQILLLRRMAERGLYVTVVLDCCHSGGAMRGLGTQRGPNHEVGRGVPQPDMTKRPRESLVGTPAELATGWGGGKPGQRDAAPAHALRTRNAWVLLAACQSNEQAFGLRTPEGTSHGILTYEWLKALEDLGPGATYQAVYDRILPRIRKLLRDQTPVLYGDGDRLVFGKDRISRRSTVAVTDILEDGRELLLNTGPIQGVFQGARFGIYPQACELADAVHRLAEVEVIEVSATDSLARVLGDGPVWPDASQLKAMHLHPGSVQLQSAVGVLDPEVPPRAGRKAVDSLKNALAADSSGFVRLASGAEKPDFHVELDRRGDWQIRNPWRQPIAFPVVPAVAEARRDTAAEVVRLLVQLTKFRNLDGLVNSYRESPLYGKLGVEWEGQSGTRLHLSGAGGARLRIVNRSSSDLNVAMLILRSDGSVQWAELGPERGRYALLRRGEGGAEGEELRLTVTPRPAPGGGRVRERLKVFASLRGVANFGWLELPPWDGRPLPRPNPRVVDPLEQILASLAGAWPAMREVVITGRSEREWVVETLDLEYGAEFVRDLP